MIIQQKWESLAAYIFNPILRDLPKSDRFTLGNDIRDIVWKTERVLIKLSLRYGNRYELLNTIDENAKVLLAMIRLGINIGAIPQKRYEPVSTKLVEIGKIVGGLKKVR